MAKAINSMRDISSGYASAEDDWVRFLQCWGDALNERASKSPEFTAVAGLIENSRNRLSTRDAPGRALNAVALENREQQSGTRLPRSYRDFVLVSGGYWVASLYIDPTNADTNLLPLDRVGPFKEVDKLNWKSWYDAADGVPPMRSLPANLYYRYDNSQDDFRWEYLDVLLKVGELEQGAVLLLNPREITSDGEWEAWILSTQIGARRYRSFAELMQMIAYQETLGVGGKFVPPDKLNSTCARHLKTIANLGHTAAPR